MKATKRSCVALRWGCGLFGFALSAAGCNVDPSMPDRHVPRGPQTTVGDPTRVDTRNFPRSQIRPSDQQEVDLVEEMTAHRTAYLQSLEKLRDFYSARGYAEKQAWADHELKGLRGLRTFRYVMDAEVPKVERNPIAAVEDADALYERGLALMRKGGHGVPVFYSEKQMVEAADLFKLLIERYPNSDKVDDAAFQLGEIYKEYMKDQESIAVQWYERALQWDSDSPHPVRFQAAVVYDYRLHNRDRALELYQEVVRREEKPLSNIIFANRRIQELTASQRNVIGSP